MTLSNKNLGFTLMELLVAMSLSAVVMTGVYTAYQSQQKSYVVQEEVAALQQNLRTAMYYMASQIREAGCNPSSIQGTNAPGIITANVNSINFTSDLRGNDFDTEPDGNTNGPYENITYSLYTSDNIQKLGIQPTAAAALQPVIENVDALNFVYFDEDGNRLDDGGGNVTTAANIARIRSVEVSLVARASREDPEFMDDNAYSNQLGEVILGAQNDHFRRRARTMRIACRNLGL